MSAWQPIETAPRDGTPILVAGGDLSMEFTGIAPHPMVAAWVETEHGMEWLAHCGLYVDVVCQGPSHWLPFPHPPIGARMVGHRKASAIETQRATTAGRGPQDESAVGAAETPQ